MSKSRSRIDLTLHDKVRIIEMRGKNVPVTQIMQDFKCGKTAVYEVFKNRDEIMDRWINNANGNQRRKARVTGNEKINESVWEWFISARAKSMPISGPILQAQAMRVAESLKITTFKASTGWLDSFKKRHGIVWNEVCGEANDVNQDTVSDWKSKLEALTADYAPRDVFNGDETGLFYRALPTKSLCLRGEKCVGGKMSKERLTLFLCGNMAGEMEKCIIIGKAKQPRCFRKLNVTTLPVIWKHNKRAWMTGSIMEEWLRNFNARMKREHRKVILFLDNATCHPRIRLSNVQLAWFPPNTTSVTQPMDQGVIHNFKTYYRRQLLQSIIPKIDTCKNVTEVAKSVTVLDAIYWTRRAIKEILPSTVSNCFRKAGFPNDKVETSSQLREISDDGVEEVRRLCMLNEDFLDDPEVFIHLDDELSTEQDIGDAVNFIQDDNSCDEEEEPVCEDNDCNSAIKNNRDALAAVNDLLQFSSNSNHPDLVQIMYKARTLLEVIAAKTVKQQTLPEMWCKNEEK